MALHSRISLGLGQIAWSAWISRLSNWGVSFRFSRDSVKGLIRIHLPEEHIQGMISSMVLVLIQSNVFLQFVVGIFQIDPGIVQGFLGIENRQLDPGKIIFRNISQTPALLQQSSGCPCCSSGCFRPVKNRSVSSDSERKVRWHCRRSPQYSQ